MIVDYGFSNYPINFKVGIIIPLLVRYNLKSVVFFSYFKKLRMFMVNIMTFTFSKQFLICYNNLTTVILLCDEYDFRGRLSIRIRQFSRYFLHLTDMHIDFKSFSFILWLYTLYDNQKFYVIFSNDVWSQNLDIKIADSGILNRDAG